MLTSFDRTVHGSMRLMVVAFALIAGGCQHDPVVTNSFYPTDYRDRHPIVVTGATALRRYLHRHRSWRPDRRSTRTSGCVRWRLAARRQRLARDRHSTRHAERDSVEGDGARDDKCPAKRRRAAEGDQRAAVPASSADRDRPDPSQLPGDARGGGAVRRMARRSRADRQSECLGEHSLLELRLRHAAQSSRPSWSTLPISCSRVRKLRPTRRVARR